MLVNSRQSPVSGRTLNSHGKCQKQAFTFFSGLFLFFSRFGSWVKFPSFYSHPFGSLLFKQEPLDSLWTASLVVPAQSPLFVNYKHIRVCLFPVPKAHFYSSSLSVRWKRSWQYHCQTWGQCWADRPKVSETLPLPAGGKQKLFFICVLIKQLRTKNPPTCDRKTVSGKLIWNRSSWTYLAAQGEWDCVWDKISFSNGPYRRLRNWKNVKRNNKCSHGCSLYSRFELKSQPAVPFFWTCRTPRPFLKVNAAFIVDPLPLVSPRQVHPQPPRLSLASLSLWEQSVQISALCFPRWARRVIFWPYVTATEGQDRLWACPSGCFSACPKARVLLLACHR